MEKSQVFIDFLSIGCNNETGTFDQYNGYLMYAGGKNILISRIPDGSDEGPRICALPSAPKGRVHACKWIYYNTNKSDHINDDNSDALRLGALVASEDGHLRVYSCVGDPLDYLNWSLASSYDLREPVVLASWTTIERENNENILLVACTVKGNIYQIFNDKVSFVCSYAPKKVTALAVSPLPSPASFSPFILAALSDSTIKVITTAAVEDCSWTEKLSLSGHQNWITSLNIKRTINSQHIYVLSASLDKSIRMWKIEAIQEIPLISNTNDNSTLLELVPQKNTFSLSPNGRDINFRFTTDSIALGHENAVYFANFVNSSSNAHTENDLSFISGSSDRSLIVWTRGFSDTWRTSLQLGDLTGSLGTIGTDHTFTFYGATLYNNNWIVASTSTGSVLFWKKEVKEDSGIESWTPQRPITGHTGRVEACSWEPSTGPSFIVSTSKDQTTRIFANGREISRPQIHGYDMKCLAIGLSSSNPPRFELISGADEKVIRIFQAPRQFYRRLYGLEYSFDSPTNDPSLFVPEAAELPALGLSNKISDKSDDSLTQILPNDVAEGELVRRSLWPEVDKLYGHNQEIYALALSSDFNFAASAAKSHLAADAAIRLWSRNLETRKWCGIGTVSAHTLTAVKLVFSPDSSLLLSVSRDRCFALIHVQTATVLHKIEAHSRIVWTADWYNSTTFVTGSRDKSVKIWKIIPEGYGEQEQKRFEVKCLHSITFDHGITAVSIKNDVLAIGDEVGNVFIYKLQIDDTDDDGLDTNNLFSNVFTVLGGGGIGPADSITDLKWNLQISAFKLAVASADNSIRILTFSL